MSDAPGDIPLDDTLRQPLPRLTRRVFRDLAIWMMALGFLMGVVFPFFVIAFGVPSRYVLTPLFFAATVSAGLVVGASNQWLSRAVVGSRLRFMRSRMTKVEHNLRETIYSDDPTACTPESCSIPVDSDDEIGEAAASFNRLVEALATSHQVTDISRRFATTLSSHIELGPLGDAALRDVQTAGGFAAAALCIVRDGKMVTAAANGFSDASAVATSEPVLRAYRTLERVHLDVPDDLALDGGVVAFRPRTVVTFPLHLRLVPIGVLLVASTGPISDDDERLLDQMLANFSVALNNALSHERLQRVAAIDMLTGLYNRRFGLERLGEDFSRAVRSQEPLGLILFDIDHFKSVNDQHGHALGDDVLRKVANVIASFASSPNDTAARYGGEEFVVLMRNCTVQDGYRLAETIRACIARAIILRRRTQEAIGRITASFGVAARSPVHESAETWLDRADKALYASKQAGRNRVSVAE